MLYEGWPLLTPLVGTPSISRTLAAVPGLLTLLATKPNFDLIATRSRCRPYWLSDPGPSSFIRVNVMSRAGRAFAFRCSAELFVKIRICRMETLRAEFLDTPEVKH